MSVCRLVEGFPADRHITEHAGGQDVKAPCLKCGREVYVEESLEDEPKICILCADPETNLFLEMPADDFGRRFVTRTVGVVRELENGTWHFHGFWHDMQRALNYGVYICPGVQNC